MGVKLILPLFLMLVSLFVVSCTSETDVGPEPKLYIVEEPKPKVFVAGDENPINWIDSTKPQRHEIDTVRALRDYEDNLKEFEFESRFSNVRRVVVNELGQSELIVGYEEEIDNPGFEEIK